MHTICSFIVHCSTPTIVSKFDPELLVGCGSHYIDLFIGSSIQYDQLWDQRNDSLESGTDFCKIQYCLLLLPNVIMCKNCNTEPTAWCCCKLQHV
jgi:hypothetical protein